jgi:hypothetical protein
MLSHSPLNSRHQVREPDEAVSCDATGIPKEVT